MLGKNVRAGTGSFADLRFETRETHRIIDARHNGRSCCSLPSPGSSCPSTCVYNPEAFAGARTCRRVGKILMSWDPAIIVYVTSLRISSPFFLDNARDRLPSDHLDRTIYVCGNILKYSYVCMCDTEIKQ